MLVGESTRKNSPNDRYLMLGAPTEKLRAIIPLMPLLPEPAVRRASTPSPRYWNRSLIHGISGDSGIIFGPFYVWRLLPYLLETHFPTISPRGGQAEKEVEEFGWEDVELRSLEQMLEDPCPPTRPTFAAPAGTGIADLIE